MVDQIVHYVVLSGGLLAIMPLLFVLTLAVGLERWWLLARTVRAGKRVQMAMRTIGYRDIDGLRAIGRQGFFASAFLNAWKFLLRVELGTE